MEPAVSQIRESQYPQWTGNISNGIARLEPAYFAAVMATGIVSIACHFQSWNWIAVGLSWLNCLIFVVLVRLNLIRMSRFPRQMWNDLIDHNRGVGFFILFAAVCVLGTQLIVVFEFRMAAVALWWLGVGLWSAFIYLISTGFAVKAELIQTEEDNLQGRLIFHSKKFRFTKK